MDASTSGEGAPGASRQATKVWLVEAVEVNDDGEPIVNPVSHPCGTPGCELPDRHAGLCTSLQVSGTRKRRLPAALADATEGSEEEEAAPGGGSHSRVPAWRRHAASSSTCDGRQRVRCKHGRERSRCKDCGGSSFCEHGRQRNRCKDCGGSSICEHGRRRSQCKDCGGCMCEHGRRRSIC